jgi:hypothetical protein
MIEGIIWIVASTAAIMAALMFGISHWMFRRCQRRTAMLIGQLKIETMDNVYQKIMTLEEVIYRRWYMSDERLLRAVKEDMDA